MSKHAGDLSENEMDLLMYAVEQQVQNENFDVITASLSMRKLEKAYGHDLEQLLHSLQKKGCIAGWKVSRPGSMGRLTVDLTERAFELYSWELDGLLGRWGQVAVNELSL